MHPVALHGAAFALHERELLQAAQGAGGGLEHFACWAKRPSAADTDSKFRAFSNIRCTQVRFDGEDYFFRWIMVGTKGDWPFLRSAYALNNGYNCLKKCHLCQIDEAWPRKTFDSYHFT